MRAVIRDLNPIFEIEGKRHVMLTQAIPTIPAKLLRRSVASLQSYHNVVLRALDILLTGI